MNIVLHVGPHKTGTTSIQRHLLDTFGSPSPEGDVWYPQPTEGGPGHSIIAGNTLRSDGAILAGLIRRAEAADVSTVLFSSEDFDVAYPDRIDRISRHLEGHSIRLVVTLNAPASRFASSWQELVKHGYSAPLPEASDRILGAAGYQPDFAATYASAVAASEVSIIISSRGETANTLIRNAMSAMDLPAPPDAKGELRLNQRFGYVEIEMLRAINEFVPAYLSAEEARALRKKLMSSLRKSDWQDICREVPIETPDWVRPRLNDMARSTVQVVERLREQGARIYGDPMLLVEDDALSVDACSWGAHGAPR